ncbi:MAG: Rrf2 family transcriptional regulator [Alphaproteobacteria bacterium]|nr:Rrf2 family transcriptional regulator [Alphaproteobacteria bacterium]
MKLSTKSRYAVMAICDLAERANGKPVSLADIAQRQDISLSYLEQLFARLRRAGLVKSVRGPGGGYLLGKTASEIKIAAIVQAIDNETKRGGSGAGSTKADKQPCQTHDLWEQLGKQMFWYLNRVTVEDVLVGTVPGATTATDSKEQAAAD